MKHTKCSTCTGTGEVLGKGFMKEDCKKCEGSGSVLDTRESIKRLREQEPSLSDSAAKKILDEEIDKAKGKKHGRKRLEASCD